MNLKTKSENLNFYKTELKKTELLLEINKKIAGLKNLSEILWTIIDFVTENVDGDRGTLFLNDSETNELYSRVAQGELTREIRILNTVGIAGAIFTSQQGEIIHDVYSDSRFNGFENNNNNKINFPNLKLIDTTKITTKTLNQIFKNYRQTIFIKTEISLIEPTFFL